MNVRFSEGAKTEFLNSIEYYETQQTNLGKTFSDQVFSAIERINEYPEGWTPLDRTFNRCLVNQFPYALIYTIMDNQILITSVMNLHRKPDYWRNK
jgi:hypothetical protein